MLLSTLEQCIIGHMKKTLLGFVGKAILWVSPIIWNFKGAFWFNLHQSMGRFVTVLNYRHQLDLFKDDAE